MLRSAAATLFAALLASSAGAGVNVSFVEPARYTDASDWNLPLRETLVELERHLQGLDERYLPSGYTLDIAIYDVKLAGWPRTVRTGVNPEVRVMTGDADWPRIDVAYTLRSGDTVLRRGREILVDPAYLRRTARGDLSTVLLAHEKRMLDDWFAARFGELQQPHGVSRRH